MKPFAERLQRDIINPLCCLLPISVERILSVMMFPAENVPLSMAMEMIVRRLVEGVMVLQYSAMATMLMLWDTAVINNRIPILGLLLNRFTK